MTTLTTNPLDGLNPTGETDGWLQVSAKDLQGWNAAQLADLRDIAQSTADLYRNAVTRQLQGIAEDMAAVAKAYKDDDTCIASPLERLKASMDRPAKYNYLRCDWELLVIRVKHAQRGLTEEQAREQLLEAMAYEYDGSCPECGEQIGAVTRRGVAVAHCQHCSWEVNENDWEG